MLKGMKRKEEKRKNQEKRYLSAQDTLAERNLNKLMENTNWYKEKETRDAEKTSSFNFEMFGDNEKGRWKEKTQSWKGWRRNRNIKKKVGEKMEDTRNKLQSVIFLQHTPNSELAKRVREKLRELEKVGKVKIKIVERTGDKLSDILHKSDSWDDEDCGRLDCLPCASAGEKERKGKCKKRNIIYETYCEICELPNEDQPICMGITDDKEKEMVGDRKKGEKKKEYKNIYIGETLSLIHI